MPNTLLRFNNVAMCYHSPAGETRALDGFSLDVREGDFVAIIGPSGCGKSTVMSLASGLLMPDEGEITLCGEPVTEPSARIGYMLQKDHLFDWLNIERNAHVGLRVRGEENAQAREHVNQLLKSTGLWDFRGKFPRELSGGMRQRAALVRTLALNPDLLLLDEPFSALDSQTRVKLADEIKTVLSERGATAVLVTHDVAEAVSMASRVVVLTKRPARVLAIHDIDIEGMPLERRRHPRFKEFFDLLWNELDVIVA